MDLFEDKSVARTLRLEREFYLVEFSEFNSLVGLTRKIREIWDDLIASGGDMTTERMAKQLLFKLPPRFDSYYQGLICSRSAQPPT